MVATSTSAIGHEMGTPHSRTLEGPQESEVFLVKCSMEGDRAMARADQQRGVKWDKDGNSEVTAKQYQELIRLGIPHTVVQAPPSYKPPIVKVQRK